MCAVGWLRLAPILALAMTACGARTGISIGDGGLTSDSPLPDVDSTLDAREVNEATTTDAMSEADGGCPPEDAGPWLAVDYHCSNLAQGLRICGCYDRTRELEVFSTCMKLLAGETPACVGEKVCSLTTCPTLEASCARIAATLPPAAAGCFEKKTCFADLLYGVGICRGTGC